jgi:hypothetical protein
MRRLQWLNGSAYAGDATGLFHALSDEGEALWST